ncbi:Flagellar biosynthesis protein FliR [Acidisarcina polymorpha]|uniref:Flagellar biosynthesis protein FliR n=1 Tax=Acidisarcina polymorpha TaxID=2211140 RepID=A0A2Z5FS06_9BACT|nr:flagellar biosynthetic protein FliR [Acidisarcina polymorpha]AXC09512.1 Flagellar biosynthesis protein FliR [Acidisarcina polymorpha]
MDSLIPNASLDWSSYLIAMVLVAVRLSGLLVFAPIFSSLAIAMRVKAIFLLALSVLLAPVVAAFPRAHLELGLGSIAGELTVGLLFGFLLSMVQEMLSFAGQVLGFQFSFSLVNLLDPNSSVQTPLLGQFFTLIGTLVLIAAGLDRVLVAALIRSFVDAPLGGVWLGAHTGLAVVGMAGGIFASALQMAAPALSATMLIEVTIALLGKISPQLPVLAITVPLKTIAGYVVLIGSLALWPRFIEARFSGLLDAAMKLLREGLTRP